MEHHKRAGKGGGEMWRVQRYEEVTSTNDICKQLAQSGGDNTAVIAKRQSAGRGRLGRSFLSPEGGLYLSALWRGCESGEVMRVTPMAAVAVCRAIETLCGAKCAIKWCNDVVLHGKKLGGILTESALRPDGGAEWLVVGIGINVAGGAWPPEVASIATSLAAEGYSVDCDALAREILCQLTTLRQALPAPNDWRYDYRARCLNVGHPVRVLHPNGERAALALAVDDDFGLTVRYGDGQTETVRSGEVSVRGLYGYTE